jgi:subtilisin family serine protease
MGQKHIILRGTQSSTRDIFVGPAAMPMGAAPPPTVSVEVADVSKKELAAVTRQRDVVAVAPVIPMKLIEPIATPAAAVPAAAGISWGVTAVGADTSPFSGDGIIVAVLDTGIDATHPAFAGVTLVEKNFTSEAGADQHGHGTHCAGTIFGRDVDGTRIGIARGVTKALIGKVLGADGGSSDQIVSAIQWAVQNGAHVISMSLGMDFPGLVAQLVGQGFPPALATSRALEGYRLNVQLFERLASLVRVQGDFGEPTVIIAAAGNESERQQDPDFEIAVSPPAVSEGIVSVAALGESTTGFTIATFSNTGANVSGPGVAVVSAKRGGGLVAMSGTSMACPHVAGVAALWAQKIKAAGPFTASHVTARLLASGATDKLKAGFDPFDIGTGMVRAPQV